MSTIGFYVAVIGFGLGVAFRSFFEVDLYGVLWLLVLTVALSLVHKKSVKTTKSFPILYASLGIFFFTLGILRMDFADRATINESFEGSVGQEITITGIVTREPDERERSTHLYIAVHDEIILTTTDRYASFLYGDELRVTGTLTKPQSFETELGRTFNYPKYLHARNVSYAIYFAEVEKLSSEKGNVLYTNLFEFKESFIKNIEHLIPEPQAGLSQGLLLGVKRALGSELENVFRKVGITHIVVLSGYNVMLVVVFTLFVLSFLFPIRMRLVVGLLAITAFALMVGLSATVVRASIMAGLILIARTIGRTYAVLRALMVTGFIMILINPQLLVFDIGFQLSFIATLGLILLSPHFEKRLQFLPNVVGIREFLIATVATQLFVTPILLYQIGEFSVVSVLVNVLILPMVPVAMMLTFISGLLAYVSIPLGQIIAYLANIALLYIINVAEFFAALPFSAYVVPPFPFIFVVIAYLILGYLVYRLHTSRTSHKSSTDHDLSGWTIVDMKDYAASIEKTTTDHDVKTPIFFR